MKLTQLVAAFLALGAASVLATEVDSKVSHQKSQRYHDSVSLCKHGHVGAIITFKTRARARVSIARRAGDVIKRTFNSPIVAANLTKATIDELIHDDDVIAVEADCIIVLDEPAIGVEVGTDHLPPRSSQNLPDGLWGLDRIDSRSGLDGVYRFGSATGANSRVYVLDTGIRITHDDFEGRALAGWSYGCETGSEAGCGNNWACEAATLSLPFHSLMILPSPPIVIASGRRAPRAGSSLLSALQPPLRSPHTFPCTASRIVVVCLRMCAVEGVITPMLGSRGCSSHGTHCASTVGGTTLGVAKGATIIAVQVPSLLLPHSPP